MPKSERVHVRRALSREEFTQLVTFTAADKTRWNMSGPDRAMLYRQAAGTGFRQRELRSLTPERFDLNEKDPAITVPAAYSKRLRDDRQPITADLAEMLGEWLSGKVKGEAVFKLPHRTHVARMLRADLEAARQAWIAEPDGAERDQREQSSFLAYADASGHVCDFHALRHSYVSWLVASGASVSVCQTLARHSTPTLTLGVYSHPTLADQGRALAALPLGAPPKAKQGADESHGHDRCGPLSGRNAR